MAHWVDGLRSIESDVSTILAGTPALAVLSDIYVHANNTNEQTIVEYAADIEELEHHFDMSNLTQKAEIREYEEIDGSNPRQITMKVYPDDFDPSTTAIVLRHFQLNQDYKITLKSQVAEGASRNVPYVYLMEIY